MNVLPEELQNIIYGYAHQLKYKDCMDELLQHRIKTRFNITLHMARTMMFRFNDIIIPCVNIHNINPSSHELLGQIKNKC